MDIGNKILFLRKNKGVTQEQLAQTLGVSNQAVSKWESGQCFPDIQLLPDIARYFNVWKRLKKKVGNDYLAVLHTIGVFIQLYRGFFIKRSNWV